LILRRKRSKIAIALEIMTPKMWRTIEIVVWAWGEEVTIDSKIISSQCIERIQSHQLISWRRLKIPKENFK
jgi:hypothetical protein